MQPHSISDQERELLLGTGFQPEPTASGRIPSPDPLPPATGDTTNRNRTEQREQLDIVRSFHADLDDRFEDALSRGLQQLVDVSLLEAWTGSYSQFAYSRANPTCLVLIDAVPLATPLMFELQPGFLYPVLDCLLGGGRQPCCIPDRCPTQLEQRLARRIVEWLLPELHQAWEPLLAVELTVDRTEINAQRVRLVAPSDSVTSLSFQARVAGQIGRFELCLPDRGIRRMVDKLLAGE